MTLRSLVTKMVISCHIDNTPNKIMSTPVFWLTAIDRVCYLLRNLPLKGYPIMKVYNKINPIAKTLRDKKYSKQVIPSKKKTNLDKLSEKEVRDAKTKQDT